MAEPVLQRALETVQERRKNYGPPTQHFKDVAEMRSVIFRQQVTPRQVAEAMIALKLCRDLITPLDDNLVDMAGYIDCIDQIEQG